ncbi:MAG: hypothetical protein NVS2B7_33520 [Herpetosiphon sp.]
MGKKKKRNERYNEAISSTNDNNALAKPSKRLSGTVRTYQHHILVCTDSKGKPCKKHGHSVLRAFQHAIKQRKLGHQVMVTATSHVGGCSLGPNVLIYPDGVWYGTVQPSDVDRIIEEHLVAGKPVLHLIRGQPGGVDCWGCPLQATLVDHADMPSA